MLKFLNDDKLDVEIRRKRSKDDSEIYDQCNSVDDRFVMRRLRDPVEDTELEVFSYPMKSSSQ